MIGSAGAATYGASLGATVTLGALTSRDPDGDALADGWSDDARPAGSTAALSSTAVADPTFTADVEGAYVMCLRVTDPSGACSEHTIGLDVGQHAPTAVIDRSSITVLLGETVRASAALSADADGDAPTYRWAIDARPAGSTATIAGGDTPTLAFVPDKPGMYVASVTVRDARSAAIADVTVRVLNDLSQATALPFVPDLARCAKGADRLILTSGAPPALHIVDPFVGSTRSVPLPLAAQRLSVSADGKLAVVSNGTLFTLLGRRHGVRRAHRRRHPADGRLRLLRHRRQGRAGRPTRQDLHAVRRRVAGRHHDDEP